MTLPSQMPRSSRVVASTPARGRGRVGQVALWAVIVCGVGVAGWAFFGRDARPKAAPPKARVEPTSLKTPAPETKPAASSSASAPPAVSQAPAPAAPMLTMGEKPKPIEALKSVHPSMGAGTGGAGGAAGGAPATASTSIPVTQPSTPAATPSIPAPATATPTAPATPAPRPEDKTIPPGPGPAPGGAPGVGMPSAGDSISAGRAPAVDRLMTDAAAAMASNRLVEARDSYNRALHHPQATRADAEAIRAAMTRLGETLTFSTQVVPGDAMCESYSIQAGDTLVRLARNKELGVDWRFLQRVNAMSDPGRLRLNQKLKLVRGPFHAVVYKNDYRLDLYADAKDSEGNRLFIRSFRVGLGEANSTPLGRFVVREGSRLINPHWVNPRTGERFDADDPKNPIGERWIGLAGAEPETEKLTGYGIHGTIEPESIGGQKSMGCIRMLGPDIELMYELLTERRSTVMVLP